MCDGCSKTKLKLKSNAKAAQRICDQCCQEGPAAEVPGEGTAASPALQEAAAAATAQHPATQVAHPEQKSGAAGGVSFCITNVVQASKVSNGPLVYQASGLAVHVLVSFAPKMRDAITHSSSCTHPPPTPPRPSPHPLS